MVTCVHFSVQSWSRRHLLQSAVIPLRVVLMLNRNLSRIHKPESDRLPEVKLTNLLDVILQPIEDHELPRFVEEARERQEQYKIKMAANEAAAASDVGANGQQGNVPEMLV